MTKDTNPIKDLLEPLSGHAESKKGTGLTPADLFGSVDDFLPTRGGRTRNPTKKTNTPNKQ